jgi:hypothetical protein
MNRLTSGMVASLALLVVAGCHGDPTDPLRGGITRIDAAPSQVFLELGATKTVDVSAVDDQGNQISSAYEVTSTGSGITVVRDSTFLPVFINDSTLAVPPEAPIFRYVVTGTAYGPTSFEVSAGGQKVVVPVQVTPVTGLAATFSSTTPALGDTVTLTAPAGTSFTQTALLTLPGAPDSLNPRITERDPAGAFVKFVAPPNVNAAVTITEVISTSAPTLVLHPATTEILQTPLIDSVDVNFSTVTPTMGQTVTVTSQNPLIKFDPVTTIGFQTQLNGRAAGPQGITVSADSTTLSFQAPPNATGNGNVSHFDFPGGFVLGLPTRQTITAENIGTTFNATFSNNTPGLLENVTITAPAGFKFGPLATDSVTIGGQLAINKAAAADGSTITVLPIPGSVGTAEIAGVSPTAAPQFILTLPTVEIMTVPPLEPLAGTDNPATAPTITVPGDLTDAGTFAATDCGQNSGVPCQLYKFTLAGPTTLHFTLEGSNAADLGLYFINAADGTDASQVCDALGRASPPEDCTLVFAAGTYLMAVVSFGPFYPELDPNPAFIKVSIQ